MFKKNQIIMLLLLLVLSGCMVTSNEESETPEVSKLTENIKSDVDNSNSSDSLSTDSTQDNTTDMLQTDESGIDTNTVKLSTVQMCDLSYKIPKGNQSETEAIEQLLELLKKELSTTSEDRTFFFTAYEKVSYEIIDRESDFGKTVYSGLLDNVLAIEADASVTFEGIYSPIGNSEEVPNDQYFSINLGEFYLYKMEDHYILTNNTQN